MSAKTFTDRQGQYLAFIDAYTRVNGRPPAESDIQRRFGVSPPSVHQMVLTLERLGLIRRRPGWRAASRCSSPPSTCPCYATPNPSNPLCRGTSPSKARTFRLDIASATCGYAGTASVPGRPCSRSREPHEVCVQVMRSPVRSGWPMESRSEPDPRTTMRPTISWPMITGSSTFSASEPCQR